VKEKRGLRAFRIEDSIWNRAREKSAKEGTSVSAILRNALHSYIQKPKRKGEKNAERFRNDGDSGAITGQT